MSPQKKVSPPDTLVKPLTPRLLSLKSAATYLGCAVWTVRELCWAREFNPIRIGKRDCIDLVDLNAWIERKKKAA
jgi:excisionase family DNA binding protein